MTSSPSSSPGRFVDKSARNLFAVDLSLPALNNMSSDLKRPREEAKPADTVLPLQEWLKLLAGRGVNMRVAMGLAGKMWVPLTGAA